uniref:Uncharacterized protein n=1 Tax=Rhizophora mucronata TaxID=61149 RepID=A0A2P2M4S3_RHIMU
MKELESCCTWFTSRCGITGVAFSILATANNPILCWFSPPSRNTWIHTLETFQAMLQQKELFAARVLEKHTFTQAH